MNDKCVYVNFYIKFASDIDFRLPMLGFCVLVHLDSLWAMVETVEVVWMPFRYPKSVYTVLSSLWVIFASLLKF